jgi:glycine oxidase
MDAFDVAIVGGGLIGVSSAFELAARKLRVVVVDRQQPGCEASWAAAGMLAPGPEAPESFALVPLLQESFRLYPGFVQEIEEHSGKRTDFRREGTLEIFFGAEGEPARDRFLSEHERVGIRVQPVSLDTARVMERSLGPAAVAAAWLEEEASIDPRLLMDRALSAARKRGVEVRSNFAVTALDRAGGRCVGIIGGGEKIPARHVVITAGCFSGAQIGDLGRYAPTHPVRGQMIALRPRAAAQLTLRRVVRSRNGYLVPRSDGRILAGSTLENAGFEKTVTPAGLAGIMHAAAELIPTLTDAETVETWAGLRPGTPDGLPILGPTDIEGLFVATGHYRNGILLAPLTANLVARWITGEKLGLNVDPFSPLRFAARVAPQAC